MVEAFRPSIAHIDSSILDDEPKKALQNKLKQRAQQDHQDRRSSAEVASELIDCMLDHVPKHKNGRVARHGWTTLANATNIVLAAFEAEKTVSSQHLRNRDKHLKRSSTPAKVRGRPRKINQALGGEIRTFVDQQNTKSGVTVKELARNFKVCERTMRDYILLFFQQKDTGIKKDEKIARLKEILTLKWGDDAHETPAIAKRTRAIVMKLNGSSQTLFGTTNKF